MSITEFKKVKASKSSLTKRKLRYGKAINDAWYNSQFKVDGKWVKCPAMDAWSKMIFRAYNDKFHAKQPTYKDVTVCEEWLTFSNFARWYELNYVKGWALDKDIKIPSNKIYSPDACMYVPQSINQLLTDSEAARGSFPIGVSFDKVNNKYMASIRIKGRHNNLGRFITVDEASKVYRQAKNTDILCRCKEYPELACYLKQHIYSEGV